MQAINTAIKAKKQKEKDKAPARSREPRGLRLQPTSRFRNGKQDTWEQERQRARANKRERESMVKQNKEREKH